MPKTLYKYDGKVNKFVWFTTWDHALRNYYNDDFNYVPRPIAGNEFNTCVEFRSRRPGVANVDWGDGVKGQFPMTKVRGTTNDYRIIFRSLNVEYHKNPDASTWWFKKEDGSQYVPIPNHAYADGRRDIQRTVAIDFTCDIYFAYIRMCKMTSFPIVDIPGIEYLNINNTAHINDGIPFDRLAKAVKLSTLILSNIGKRIAGMPKAITSKDNLVTLGLYNTLDLSDIESSGIRDIGNMKNLENLDISSCFLGVYIKELNDLPKLNSLKMHPGPPGMSDYYDLNNCPSFEVDKINPSITDFVLLDDWAAGETRTGWNDANMSGRGLGNIRTLQATHSDKLDVSNLPEYIKEMRSMSRFNMSASTHQQDRTDTFVNTLYDYIMGWDLITMSQNALDGQRNQFYGLRVDLYSSVYPSENQRPSGDDQAPEGFVLGSSNGNPTTPMEKIYVLRNNYKQNWIIKPA